MDSLVSIIAIIGRNRELGRNNNLLFNIPKDMAHFREKTMGHTIIMGRKTFESIGRPLPNRVNIVVTRDVHYEAPGEVIKVDSVEKAIEEAKKHEKEEIFIIGGAQIYEAALPYADKLYLTVVDEEVEDADVFFPEYEDKFKKIISSKGDEENGHRFTFIELEK